MDLFDYQPPAKYPDAPGYKERDTSRKSADSMKDAAPLLRDKCLAAIRRAPAGLTADEVAERLGETVLSVRPRITELLHGGKVKDTGQRRRNASQRSAKVWSAA
jgi:predicted HTH transcriptional regulator